MPAGPLKGADDSPTRHGADAEPDSALNLESATTDESNRREHRRHVVANLRVKGPITGEVLNTSHLGMAIQTNDSLTIGWSYAFRMRNGSEVIRIPGKIQWCRLVQLLRVGENEFLPVFRMGIHLAGNLWGKPQNYYYP